MYAIEFDKMRKHKNLVLHSEALCSMQERCICLKKYFCMQNGVIFQGDWSIEYWKYCTWLNKIKYGANRNENRFLGHLVKGTMESQVIVCQRSENKCFCWLNKKSADYRLNWLIVNIKFVDKVINSAERKQ